MRSASGHSFLAPPAGPITSDDVAADLVRSAIGRDLAALDDVTVTRTLHHRHLRWRRNTRLHWSETCSQMSGRSPVSRRTVQFSTADSEQLDMVCTACRPRRSSALNEVLTAASLTELVDHYARPGDCYRTAEAAGTLDHSDVGQARRDAATARRHARRASQLTPAAKPVRDAVDARRALPLSGQLLDLLSVQLWRAAESDARRTLSALGADGALDALSRIPPGAGASRHRQIQETLTRHWPQVPAGTLAAVAPDSGGGKRGAGAYAILQTAWLQRSGQAAATWLQERDRLLRQRQRGDAYLALASYDLNDGEVATQFVTPCAVAVCVQQHYGLRLYSMPRVAAEICHALLPEGSLALVGDDSSDLRELGLLALTLCREQATPDLPDAVETARAAWSS